MGYLQIIIGPMFSGKTSELIKIYNEKKNIGEKVFAINYDQDTRYGIDMIVSHDKQSISSCNINKLHEINCYTEYKNCFKEANWIFINEAQFFKDLKPWVIDILEETNKYVILCGLDSDFKRHRFGELLDLIPHANQVTKLYGVCQLCKSQSLYTRRITTEQEQEVIGNTNYIPVCRNCYKKDIDTSTYISLKN